MNNWGQNLSDKLKSVSPKELDYQDVEKHIWERIAKSRLRTFRLRPVFTHVAAGLAGIVLSGTIMFLFFKNAPGNLISKTELIASNTPAVQPDLVTKENQDGARPSQQAAEHQHTAFKKQPEIINQNHEKKLVKQNSISPEKTELDTPPALHLESRQTVSKMEPEFSPKAVVYWSDIREKYAQPQVPGTWVKIKNKFSRSSIETDSINRSPVIALAEVFR